MRNKWLGLGVTVLLAVAGIVAVFFGFTEGGSAPGWYGAVVFGSLSLLGQIPYYIAFRMLGDKENIAVALLRGILVLAGSAIIVVAAGLAGCIHTTEVGDLAESAWKAAFGGCWLLGGVISFHLFYSACEDDWEEGLYPFIGLISVAIGYAVCVALCFLGQKAGSFFSGWLVLLLGLAGIVLGVLRLIKVGSPFSAPAGGSGSGNNGGKGNDGGKGNNGNDTRTKGTEKGLKDFVWQGLPECDWNGYWQYGKIFLKNRSLEMNGRDNAIKVYMTLYLTIDDPEYAADNNLRVPIEQDRVAEDFLEKTRSDLESRLEKYRKEYSGFDDWTVDADEDNCKVKLVKEDDCF